MYDPASDLTILKKLCKEMQKELAPMSNVDKKEVRRLAEDMQWLAENILKWARTQ